MYLNISNLVIPRQIINCLAPFTSYGYVYIYLYIHIHINNIHNRKMQVFNIYFVV